ncbi:MAG: hypothetical protein KTR21_00525 [Rhodobacteraceae bacterium]|nr:hypothetical protein [Paracoccaceae bacterium]
MQAVAGAALNQSSLVAAESKSSAAPEKEARPQPLRLVSKTDPNVSETKMPEEAPEAAPPRGAAVDATGQPLSREQLAIVDQLKSRDREVRAHEEAHARVGGQYAGAPHYDYETGPDGNRYAIGGEVSIDVAPVNGDPEATVAKMDIVKAAALAPAEPSAQDRKVAAIADRTRALAQAELIELRAAERRGESDADEAPQARLQAAVEGYADALGAAAGERAGVSLAA